MILPLTCVQFLSCQMDLIYLNMFNTFDSIDTLTIDTIISYNINVVRAQGHSENTFACLSSDEAVTPAWPVWFWYHPAAMRWAEMPTSGRSGMASVHRCIAQQIVQCLKLVWGCLVMLLWWAMLFWWRKLVAGSLEKAYTIVPWGWRNKIKSY